MARNGMESRIRWYAAAKRHTELVKAGEYSRARMLLRLLRKGSLRLGLDDDSYYIEDMMYELGATVKVNRRGIGTALLHK